MLETVAYVSNVVNGLLVLITRLFGCSAMSVGTDMLEIDCHLTKDGKVIVSHDSSLKRVCDSVGVVADYDFEVGIYM